MKLFIPFFLCFPLICLKISIDNKLIDKNYTTVNKQDTNKSMAKEDFESCSNCRTQDSLMLVELYHATGGENWTYENIRYSDISGTLPLPPLTPNSGQIWDFTQPIDTWHGVELNAEGCVRLLILESNGLVGTLPANFSLPQLEEFHLSHNDLTGSIPAFDNMFELREFWCEANALSGALPNFNLPKLEYLNCLLNDFSGPLPDFTNLNSLLVFYGMYNNFSGAIPNFSNMQSLKVFWCYGNQLSGAIPNFSNMPNLEEFWCGGNQLTDTIPDFSNSPNLYSFFCSGNQLTGRIPDFCCLPNLIEFGCSWNKLEHIVPDLSNNCPLLQSFDYRRNQITFEDILPYFTENATLISTNSNNTRIPRYSPQDSIYTDTIFYAASDEAFHIDLGIDADILDNQYIWYKDGAVYDTAIGNNQLEFESIQDSDAGTYWVHITNPGAPDLTLESYAIQIVVDCPPGSNTCVSCNRTQDSLMLVELYHATGGDNWTYETTGFAIVDLEDNSYVPIPNVGNVWDFNQAIDTWHGVKLNSDGCVSLLVLNECGLTGAFPDLNLPFLKGLHICINELSGAIPNFSHLSNLETFGCHHNLFNEPLPDFNLPNLRVFNCAQNLLEGTIPDFSNMPKLKFLFCDVNSLSGEIPDFSNLPNLEWFSCSSNSLTGEIPDFSNLPKLKILSCGRNNLTGSIPDFSNLPELSIFACRHNNLTGLMPNFADNCPQLIGLSYPYNKYTFENILPYFTENKTLLSTNSGFPNTPGYSPQDSIYTDTIFYAASDEAFHIDLGIDADILDNQYVWYKDGAVYDTIIGNNQLAFEAIQASDAGTYWVHITNPGAPALTLESYAIQIIIGCPPVSTSLVESLCTGSTYSVGEEVFTAAGYYEVTLTNEAGCDSLVQLTLEVADEIHNYQNIRICEGETFEVGDSTYQQSNNYINSFVTENGCDSIVHTELEVIQFNTSIIGESVVCQNQPTLLDATITDCEDCTYVWSDFPTINSGEREIYPLESGTYSVTVSNSIGCSTSSEFFISVNNLAVSNLTESICSGSSYMVGDTSFMAEGLYLVTLQTYEGCDSFVTLDLDIFPTYEFDISVDICEGESYQLGTTSYHQTGIYQDQLQTQNGCDSMITLNLRVLPTYEDIQDIRICEGESYVFGEVEYTNTGNYQQQLQTENGCDSTLILNLEVLPVYTENFEVSLCEGESYMVGSTQYHISGNYQEHLMTEEGCDSILNLSLTVFPSYEQDLDLQICEGESYPLGTNSYSTSGNYVAELQTIAGCDSIIHLALTVLPVYEESIDISICEGTVFELGDMSYDSSGDYVATLQSEQGCDSIINLHLDVLSSFEEEQFVTICEGESYVFGEVDYSSTGNYQQLFTSQNGCDSLVHLMLTVENRYEQELEARICAGETYVLANQTYTETGDYQKILSTEAGCDSVLNLNLLVLPVYEEQLSISICEGESYTLGEVEYNSSGIYQQNLLSHQGCDSTLILDLLVLTETELGIAEAGEVREICESYGQLVGNLPPNTTGRWTSTGESFIENPTAASTMVEDLEAGENVFIWTLSTAECVDYSRDEVSIYRFVADYNLKDDAFDLPYKSGELTGELISNDTWSADLDWSIRLYQAPIYGTVEIAEDGSFEYQINQITQQDSFMYEVYHPYCPEMRHQAHVLLQISDLPDETIRGITPNGDGKNETLTFPDLDNFPDNELVIFNRWGDLVYQAQPYANEWGGTLKNTSNPLPEGTYYYIMRFDIGEGDIEHGQVVVIR